MRACKEAVPLVVCSVWDVAIDWTDRTDYNLMDYNGLQMDYYLAVPRIGTPTPGT